MTALLSLHRLSWMKPCQPQSKPTLEIARCARYMVTRTMLIDAGNFLGPQKTILLMQRGVSTEMRGQDHMSDAAISFQECASADRFRKISFHARTQAAFTITGEREARPTFCR